MRTGVKSVSPHAAADLLSHACFQPNWSQHRERHLIYVLFFPIVFGED
jgi:hypothetical protein